MKRRLRDFSRGFYQFSLPQISFHNFSTLISFISSAHVMLYEAWSAGILAIHRSSNIGASSQLVLRSSPVSDTSWTFILKFRMNEYCAYEIHSFTWTPSHSRNLVYFIFRKNGLSQRWGRVWLSERYITRLTGIWTPDLKRLVHYSKPLIFLKFWESILYFQSLYNAAKILLLGVHIALIYWW